MNLLFVLLILFYLNILKPEEMLQFWNEKFSQEVKLQIHLLLLFNFSIISYGSTNFIVHLFFFPFFERGAFDACR